MLTYLIVAVSLAIAPPAGFDSEPILDAIERVETGGHADPANAVGDGGKALGPYQIHRVYWQDAVERDLSLVADGQTYDNVRDVAYAERVILAYWSRYAKAWTHEELARIHNGGPKGYVRKATLGYWAKVRAALDLTR